MSAKSKKLTEHEMLYVRWRDSTAKHGWYLTDEMMAIAEDTNDMLCETVGFLVKATRHTLSVAHSSGIDRSSAHHIMRIPRECVIFVHRLKDGGRRRLWK